MRPRTRCLASVRSTPGNRGQVVDRHRPGGQRAGGLRRMIGWSGAMRRSSSSPDPGPTPSKNLPTSHFPALQMGAQDRQLVVVGEFAGAEVLCAAAEQQAALASDAEVADPVRVAARRDEVARPLEGQQVDGRTSRLAGLAATDFEHPRSRHAHTETGQRGDRPVEDMLAKPVWMSVPLGDPAILTAPYAAANPRRSSADRQRQPPRSRATRAPTRRPTAALSDARWWAARADQRRAPARGDSVGRVRTPSRTASRPALERSGLAASAPS